MRLLFGVSIFCAVHLSAMETYYKSADEELLYTKAHALCMHVEANDFEAVQQLLADGAPANGIDIHRPLHEAKSAAMTELLLRSGACPNSTGFFGRRPLHVVHDADSVDLLLQAGASLKARDKNGQTPLFYVHSVAVAQLLIAAGARVNARDKKGYMPLHKVSAWTSVDLVKLFLSRGASARARSHEGATPLHSAAEGCGSQAIMGELIAAGADVDARDKHGQTPLHATCGSCGLQEDALRALLALGADPNAQDTKGRTCAHLLVDHFMRVDSLTCLGQHGGVDFNVKDTRGRTPMDVYVYGGTFGGIFWEGHSLMKNVALLIRFGAYFTEEHADHLGWLDYPWHSAALFGSIERMEQARKVISERQQEKHQQQAKKWWYRFKKNNNQVAPAHQRHPVVPWQQWDVQSMTACMVKEKMYTAGTGEYNGILEQQCPTALELARMCGHSDEQIVRVVLALVSDDGSN